MSKGKDMILNIVDHYTKQIPLIPCYITNYFRWSRIYILRPRISFAWDPSEKSLVIEVPNLLARSMRAALYKTTRD